MTIFSSASFFISIAMRTSSVDRSFTSSSGGSLRLDHDVGDPLDELRLVDRVRDAVDVDRLGRARLRADVPGAAQADRAGAGLVDLLQLVRRIQNLAAGREVGALDVAAQLRVADVLVVEQLDERRADLAEVVRRDVGRHADRDAGRAVDQQVRNPRRQHDRLGLRAVVVRPEGHRRLLDLGEHLVADAREPALGVAHRGGAVAVERAEVAGAVDERIAQREGLRHADERFVERRVAVRVEAAHHVADDLRALAVLGVGGQVLLPHRVEDAALHRLQAVADVGQRARGDDRQRVVEIARLRRFVERDVLDAARSAAAGDASRSAAPLAAAIRCRSRLGSAVSPGSMTSNSDGSSCLRLVTPGLCERKEQGIVPAARSSGCWQPRAQTT